VQVQAATDRWTRHGRDFLNASGVAALSGTALGGLTAVGASLAPTLARAQELRINPPSSR
jgi:hypothetical protein